MTDFDGTPGVPQWPGSRLDEANATIRLLSVVIALMIGVVAGMGASIVSALLSAPPLGALAAGGATFIAVTTLALIIEARFNRA